MTFPGLLFIVLLVLKLTGYIAWSWWLITAPLWGVALLTMGLLAVAALIAAKR
jgi:hypothetical protein